MSAIVGKKAGGSDSHTPVESPDSLIATSFAKMLLVLGHGEWAGGLDNTRIFLDGTPIGNADGSINFPGVKWEFRPGTQHQTYIQGMPDVQNDIAVGVELKYETPWVKAITNTDLSAVRVRLSWPTLQQQLDNGDVVGYRVEYAIDLAIGGGAYREVLRSAVSGKSTTGYPRSHRIDLPASTEGWQIRVRRITKNTTNTARVADRMLVDAIVEIVDAKLRYPNLALLYIQFDAKQFQNIPTITCKPKMGILRVPSNYDPINRTYSGIWDGTFKWAWTNNPAWVFYDICINEEYGLGQWIKANNLSTSKWELYEIAKYCDQLVPDGRGGTEPRHLCNVYIQGQEDAINVLSDIISIFSGMFYWAGGEIRALADMSRPVDMVYSRANVKNGFQYSSASERTHYSQAMVSYSNPDNRYQDDIEPVVVRSLVRRYGTLNADITAIGCTRRSEAIRRGKWILYTNEKDRAVSFTVGLEGRIPLPGWVIGVADQLLAGRVLGGRISNATGRNITLDRKPDAKAGDRLIVNLPSGVAQARTIQSVNGKIVTVSVAYSELPASECGWSIDADDLAVQLYRVVGIKDASTEKEIAYEINAIEYDENKWSKIESGAIIEDRPISVIPPGVQPPPKNIEISSFSATAQGLAVTTMHAAWSAAESAIAYEIEWCRDNGNWISAPRTSTCSFDVTGIYAGRYQCRVRAINAAEISSVWANSAETLLKGKEGTPAKPVSLIATPVVFGIALSWGFPAGAEDTLKTEIHSSLSADGANSVLLTDVPYPQRAYTMQGLAAGRALWFRARLVDKTGNQGEWTDWTRGVSEADNSILLDWIGNDIINNTDAGKNLIGRIELTETEIDDAKTQVKSIAASAIETALANDANAIQQWSNYGSNRAGIIEVRQTIADNEKSFAEYQQLIIVTFKGVEASIVDVRQTQATANEAFAKFQQQTVADLDASHSAIEQVSTAQSTTDKALTEYKNNANTRFDGNEADIADIRTSVSSAESALSTLEQQTVAEFNNGAQTDIENALSNDKNAQSQREESGRIRARVTTVETAQATADQSFAEYRQQVSAEFNNANSSISDVRTAQATADKSLSDYKQTVAADFKGVNAAVQETSSALVDFKGIVSAQWSIKLGVNKDGVYYAAGISMGLEDTPEGMQSSIVFLANNFAVMSEINGKPKAFFAIKNGQTIIDAAFIGDATINFGKITDSLKSDNFVSGKTGWNLPKNGDAEFNNVTVRGNIESNDGYFGGTVYARTLKGDTALSANIEYKVGSTTGGGIGVTANTQYRLFSVDSADFDRDCTIVGSVAAYGIGTYNSIILYVNGAEVLRRNVGQDAAITLTVPNPSFIIPSRPLGLRDTITMLVTTGVRGITATGQIIITKRGSGITIG